ncbi:MAG: HAMP domain-containing sensor histidine kinase [Fibrobacter sp.]|jgi:signal transduction histidine kinase|nr:HAMP domain-containing sensor histidine kinase [Fibrobacter sp.]MDY6369092.1 HAMP domain-containing sensor histidine kinase [Fibrobacter sp.]MDY6390829.1 HAMP domain-containing sensor histidine kinase [Fibrobacter sp.]
MNRLKLLFTFLFLVIAIPVAILLVNSYKHFQTESQYAYKEQAYFILQMLNQRIYDDLAVEEQRSYSEYRFIRAVPIIGGEEVTISKLAELPIRSHYGGMIGYFQLDPDGGMHTPVLPDGILEKIPVEDRSKREIIRDSILNVLSQLGIHNEGLSRNQVQASTQDSLDKLYGKNLKLAVKLNDTKKFQRRYEQSSQTESFLFDVESARIRRISENGKMEDSEDSIQIPNLLEVEIDPFQAKFNNNYIVYYRNVWRNNEQFIQGYAVRLRTYLENLVLNELQFNPAEQGITLEFGTKDKAYVTFGSLANSKGELLNIALQFPLNDMVLSVHLTDENSSSSYMFVVLIAIIMFVALAGGFFAVYRSTKSQILLANKRQDFVSAVSHELKTPLTAIRMYAELLQNSWVANETKRQKYYALIVNETERLSRLIQNVLNLSKLERGNWNVQFSKVNPKTILDTFVATYTQNIEKHGFDLTVTSDICNMQLTLDKDAVMQILTNVVDNSLKFARDSAYKMIALELRVSENDVYFVVRDYGPGIPQKELSHVFEEFYRVGNEMTRTTAGTGIGLSMVKKLCDMTNMKIEIENAGPGLRTKLHLPLLNI